MEWERIDGVYFSKDERFSVLRATNRLHVGDWELHDIKNKGTHYGYSLKHAKQIAEDIVSRSKKTISS